MRSLPLCSIVLATLAVMFSAAGASADQVLFRFGEDFDLGAVDTQDVKLSLHGSALRVAAGHSVSWPGIRLGAPDGHWDLSAFDHVAMDVNNVGAGPVSVYLRVDDPRSDATQNWLTDQVDLKPGEQKTLRVTLQRPMPAGLRSKLFGMRGYPGGWSAGKGIDTSKITRLIVYLHQPSVDHTFEISNIRAAGTPPAPLPMDESGLFPMIDSFGQFIHKDWPGKTKSIEDLAQRKGQEAAELADRPGPEDWNRYGGWQAGPQLEATGRFRTEKRQGKWWLVDPEGRLFWSHGTDCVGSGNGSTPITDREHWFADLPDRDSPLGRFYGRSGWAPHGYYRGKSFETYNLTGANLLRKYGEHWREPFAEIAHRRLRSWGMNTIANWSDSQICAMRKTPYTASVYLTSKRLEGSEGYWGKFPDVFDPSFKQALRQSMARQKGDGEPGRAAGDPWCLGYFVDNELAWGDETSLAVAALASPPDQAAKRVFIEDLKGKYETIDRLNQSWGTAHASWDALVQSTSPPDGKKAGEDLTAFYTKTAERYFQTCRETVKEVDPKGLYLGCRFAWVNDRAVRAAAKYCDVVSFNQYKRSVADFRLPKGVDKPVVIGEFHFGALDRGMFHTGLVKVANQQQRAETYKSYVRGALRNPWIVGTHWFQYGDQATTGRGDGENYQIGLLDICDTPYPETIAACREVGYSMYPYRQDEQKDEEQPE